MKRKFPVVSMVLCALFAALIAVGAFIQIPTPTIPMTLQTLFVLLTGLLLGPRLGAIAAAVYLVTGLIGIPIFARGGGFGYVLMPTFGYIIGFIGAAALTGYLSRRKKPTFLRCLMASLAGLAILYGLGLSYWFMLSRFILQGTTTASTILTLGFINVIPGDLISAALCAALAARMLPALQRMGLSTRAQGMEGVGEHKNTRGK